VRLAPAFFAGLVPKARQRQGAGGESQFLIKRKAARSKIDEVMECGC
jgi:hypothetical protein